MGSPPGSRSARAGAALALVSTLAIAVALPPGPAAFAQTAGGAATPGGAEVVPRPGPPRDPIIPDPELDTLPEPGLVPVAPVPEPLPEPAPEEGPAEAAVAAGPVAEPDLGLADDPLAGPDPLGVVSPLEGAVTGSVTGAVAAPVLGAGLDPLGGGLSGLGAAGGLDPIGPDLGRLGPLPLGRGARIDRERLAERGPGGVTLSFGVGLRLRADSNPRLRFGDDEEGEVALATDLGFGLLSQTRRQRLALDLDGSLVASSNPGEDDESLAVEAPRLAFVYGREGARARLGAALRLRRVDLDEARVIDLDGAFDGLPGSDDLEVSDGTRTDLDAEVEIATGLDRPLGFELGLSADLRRFEDTTDPDLTDRDILGAEAALRLDLTGRLTTRLVLDATDLDDASGESRESRALGVSAAYAATERTRFTAALGGARVEALRFVDLDDDGEDDALRERDTSGVEASLGVVHDLPRGTISAGVETALEEGGRRDTIRVARGFDLSEGTSLAASVGLTRGGDDDSSVVADLAYTQDLARGALTASLRRRAGTDADGQDVVSTTAGLGLSQAITRASGVTLDLDFAVVEEEAEDESLAELRLAYVRSLTPDWSLSAGYELSRRAEGDDDATSNALFLSLDRGFLIRP